MFPKNTCAAPLKVGCSLRLSLTTQRWAKMRPYGLSRAVFLKKRAILYKVLYTDLSQRVPPQTKRAVRKRLGKGDGPRELAPLNNSEGLMARPGI
jgi:hypothetical protein